MGGRLRWVVPLVLAAALHACGSEYPSRNWGGTYLTRMVASSSDCFESPIPPPITELLAVLEQGSGNDARLTINPIVPLKGSFRGDALAARASFVDSLQLPESLARRITPADSFDTITYEFDGKFKNWRFRGEYRVRAPDVRALVKGATPLRCTMRYQLAGARFEPPALSDQPWLQGLSDSAAAGAAAPPPREEPAEPR